MFCEMILEHQDICELRQSIQLQDHLYASKVYMQEVQQSGGHNQVQKHFGQITLMLQASHAGLDRLPHLSGYTWPPEMLP